MIDLISERVGGRIVAVNDEFFAPAVNLISAHPPVSNDDYTDRGKWMDGWETRRRREPGHDWVIVALGVPGRIRTVSVDTSYFTGNYPEFFSLDATGGDDPDGEWVEIIPKTGLRGASVADFTVEDARRVEMVRLNIYPDGGVARLGVVGEPIPAMDLVCPDVEVDLAVATVGGEAVDASDVHYSPPSNLLRPGPSAGMWDGWETRRRRDDGHDWATVRLGMHGSMHRLIVDTSHFKGNAPGWVSAEVSDDGSSWTRVVERVPVSPHESNIIEMDGAAGRYVRLSIHPDGGLARLRVLGRPDRAAAGGKRLVYLNSLFEDMAARFFRTACAADVWVGEMVRLRPFSSIEAVFAAGEEVFSSLSEPDWLQAFGGHPRIGERGDATANREQAGTSTASRETIRELIDVNRRYEDKFGFTYIVYASGKTADEMLSIARDRLGNGRSQEIANAAVEQRKITSTRLARKLCQEER